MKRLLFYIMALLIFITLTSYNETYPILIYQVVYETEQVIIKYNRKLFYNHENVITLNEARLLLKYQEKEIEEINSRAAYQAYQDWNQFGRFEQEEETERKIKAILNESK